MTSVDKVKVNVMADLTKVKSGKLGSIEVRLKKMTRVSTTRGDWRLEGIVILSDKLPGIAARTKNKDPLSATLDLN